MTETITVTPKSALPQYQGRPVPWITRWSGEVNQDKFRASLAHDGVRLDYPEGNGFRDDHGVLWKREGLTRKGEPQYSEVNTFRQRAAMRKRLCQVCGAKIDERPIRWLMSRIQLEGDLTISAPTCSACIPLALELCPHLRSNDAVILRVLDYEVWGVHGQPAAFDPDTKRFRQVPRALVPYEDPPVSLSAVAAYQQVVRLTKFVIEA